MPLCMVIQRFNVWERRETICFHTKLSYEEDILGVGCEVEFHGRSRVSDLNSMCARNCARNHAQTFLNRLVTSWCRTSSQSNRSSICSLRVPSTTVSEMASGGRSSTDSCPCVR